MNDNERTKSRTRSGDILNTDIPDVVFQRADMLDHSKSQMLPSYRHLFERYLTLKDLKKSDRSVKWDWHVRELASEFIYEWVVMNVYCLAYQ